MVVDCLVNVKCEFCDSLIFVRCSLNPYPWGNLYPPMGRAIAAGSMVYEIGFLVQSLIDLTTKVRATTRAKSASRRG